MAKNDTSSYGSGLERPAEPDLLHRVNNSTLSIDLDELFTKDVTDSGSFDLSRVKDISFGKLLEAIPIPTLLIDASMSILFANQATGVIAPDSSRLEGTSFLSLFVGETEAQRAMTYLTKVISERKTQTFEAFLQIDAKTMWCRIHLRSIRFRGRRSILALIEDLTAQRKQLIVNEKYHRLVQIFPIGIAEFVLDEPVALDGSPAEVLSALADAELVGGNREFARMLGHSDIQELDKMRLRALFPFDERQRQRYQWWIMKGFPVRSFESHEKDAHGKHKYHEITLVGNIKDGWLVGLWVLRQDISHRKEAEVGLRAARDMLEQKVREKTAELVETNQLLTVEMEERLKAEEDLTRLVHQLQDALAKVRILSGLLPICASCKKIRDDSGYWTQVEVYVREHSDADFTHSICPDCAAKLYPEFFNLYK